MADDSKPRNKLSRTERVKSQWIKDAQDEGRVLMNV